MMSHQIRDNAKHGHDLGDSQEMVAPSSTAQQSGMSLWVSCTESENPREGTGLGRKLVNPVVECEAFVRNRFLHR